MLFDLQGGGRRRVIKVVYASLALLMGGGLVLFGIGGETAGGLVDAFQQEQDSNDDLFNDRVNEARERTERNPRDAAAWATRARAEFQSVSAGGGYDELLNEGQGGFTDEGKEDLARVVTSWDRHVQLAGDEADGPTSRLMVQAFGPTGLNDLPRAVSAFEVTFNREQDPTFQQYTQYAALAYAAGQSRKGDLAGRRAEELAPRDQREQVRAAIEGAKAQAAQATAGAAGAGGAAGGAVPPTPPG